MLHATPTEVADVLESAADRLEVRGWCQNTLLDKGGANCALGAIFNFRWIDEMGHSLSECDDAMEAAHYTLGAFVPDRNVVAWNNACGRTAYEVIDEMRRCAKNVRDGLFDVHYRHPESG